MERKLWKDSGFFQKAAPKSIRGTGLVADLQGWVPALSGCDLTELSLTPQEVFVLSFVNGQRSLRDIALLAGLSAEEQMQTVSKLIQLGALESPQTDAQKRGGREQPLLTRG